MGVLILTVLTVVQYSSQPLLGDRKARLGISIDVIDGVNAFIDRGVSGSILNLNPPSLNIVEAVYHEILSVGFWLDFLLIRFLSIIAVHVDGASCQLLRTQVFLLNVFCVGRTELLIPV